MIESMLKKGQIEEKDAEQFIENIYHKMHHLNLNPYDVKLMDQRKKIMFYSELAEVFSREELDEAIEILSRNDVVEYTEAVIKKDRYVGSIYYVARGEVIETSSSVRDLDNAPQIKHRDGYIGGL